MAMRNQAFPGLAGPPASLLSSPSSPRGSTLNVNSLTIVLTSYLYSLIRQNSKHLVQSGISNMSSSAKKKVGSQIPECRI
jgi:hypothetical protein